MSQQSFHSDFLSAQCSAILPSCHRPRHILYINLSNFHRVKSNVTSATTNRRITVEPEEKPVPKSSKGGFSLCMACTVYVYGICLKCYVAVDVGECLSRCGDMEILPVQGGFAHTFANGVMNWRYRKGSDADFKSSLFSLPLCLPLSLPRSQKFAKQLCLYFKRASILFSLFGRLCYESLR